MTKKALCIGINDYPAPLSKLAGCVNDANDWRDTLMQRGFEVTQLLNQQATANTMRQCMQQLTQAAQAGDTIIITYSGHGSWVPDEDGEEEDGRDEVLCPYDVRQHGPITDDELVEIFAGFADDVHVLFFSDSCHSGTVVKNLARLPNNTPRVRFLPPELFLTGNQLARARKLAEESKPRDRAPRESKVLLFSGAQDNQYSYDTVFDGKPNGAFTHFALDALKTLPNTATYTDWRRQVSQYLPNPQWNQSPDLYGNDAQKRWHVLNGSTDKSNFTPTDIAEQIANAQPGERLDFSKVDPGILRAAHHVLKQRMSRQDKPRDDETDWGQYIHSHVDWWDPWHIVGLATVELEHEAVQAFDRAITLPHLLAVGVPAPVAAIVAGVVWMLKDLDAGNGINMYVQVPSLVHWWLPR